MPPRAWSAVAALVVLGLASCGRTGPTPARDVLFVIVDTLRPDRLGAYGHSAPTSPRFDRLAAEGLLVEQAYAQSPWTRPAMASVMTSLPPSAHGVHREEAESRLPDHFTTLPELLLEAGWRTAALVENPHVQPLTGFGRGFETFQPLRKHHRRSPGVVVERALRWLDALSPEDRLFLYLHFIDPHGPYAPAPDLRARFVGERTTERRAVRGGRVSRILPDDGPGSNAPLAATDLQYLRALYDAEIRGVDRALARVLERLDELDRLDEAILVVTSDHPEEFLEHGRLRHGYQCYDVNLRIPLVVRVPGAPPRHEAEALVQHVDLAPTILDLLGLEIPASFTGQSFAPLVWGGAVEDRPVLSESRWRDVENVGLRVGPWRLVHDHVEDTAELYHLERDPRERRDLAAEQPDVLARMLAIQAELRSDPDPTLSTGAGQSPEAATELDEQLRALGYTGGD